MSGVDISDVVGTHEATTHRAGMPVYGWVLIVFLAAMVTVGPFLLATFAPMAYDQACDTIIAARSCTQ